MSQLDTPVLDDVTVSVGAEVPQGARGSAGSDDHWIVTCDLTSLNESSLAPADQLLEELVLVLAGYDAITSLDGARIVVSLTVVGSVLTATPKAVEQLWTALEQCEAEEWQISRATQISYSDFDHAKSLGVPIELLCASECAQVLEVSKQRVSQLVDAGDFPPPDAFVAGRPSWRKATIEAFKALRRAARH